MEQRGYSTCGDRRGRTDDVVSRRVAMSSSGLGLLVLLSGSAFGREEGTEADRRGSESGPPRQIQEQMELHRAFSERLRNAGSMEERMKIMEEQRAAQRRMAVEALKDQLGVSGQEWAVVKPRIEAVYNLVHPQPPARAGSERRGTELEQRSRELREILSDKAAAASRIKAGLTALRAAKQRAQQQLAAAQNNLRQVMTLRQEAVLVLNGLLD